TAPAFVDDLLEPLLVAGMRRRVVLLVLLCHDQALADHDRRRGEEREREPEREPEKLRLVRDRVPRIDDRHGRSADGGGAEKSEHEVLRTRIGLAARNRPFRFLDERTSPAATEQEHEHRDQPALHEWIRLPITAHVAISSAIAMNQVTRPSGTGPTWPSAQPPRSSGLLAYWT